MRMNNTKSCDPIWFGDDPAELVDMHVTRSTLVQSLKHESIA